MLNRTLLFFAAFALLAFVGVVSPALGQTIINDPFNPGKSGPDHESPLGSPEVEMRARLEVQRSEKLRKENLDRAREVAQLGLELRDIYSKNRSFDRDGIKKLERLEKLTRRIRSEAGGTDDEEMIRETPGELATALTRIADLSAEVRKGVEKTPRQVISASVIDRTNQLLLLINFVRGITRQDD